MTNIKTRLTIRRTEAPVVVAFEPAVVTLTTDDNGLVRLPQGGLPITAYLNDATTGMTLAETGDELFHCTVMNTENCDAESGALITLLSVDSYTYTDGDGQTHTVSRQNGSVDVLVNGMYQGRELTATGTVCFQVEQSAVWRTVTDTRQQFRRQMSALDMHYGRNMLLDTGWRDERVLLPGYGLACHRRIVGPGYCRVDDERRLMGMKTLRVERSGGTDDVYSGLRYYVPVKPQGRYTASVYWMTDDNTLFGEERPDMELHASSREQPDSRVYGWLQTVFPDGGVPANGRWVRLTGTVVMPADADVLEIALVMPRNGRLWMGCAQLEEGTVATDYMPQETVQGMLLETMAKVEQTAAGLSSTVSKVERIGDAASRNLLPDSGFKLPIDGLKGYGITTRLLNADTLPESITADTERRCNGRNALRMEGQQSGYAMLVYFVPVEIGKTYTYSFYAMTDDTERLMQNGTLFGIECKFQSADLTTHEIVIDGGTVRGALYYNAGERLNGTWQRFSNKVTIYHEDTRYLKLVFWLNKPGRIWMACPQLEEGEAMTAYKEAAADMTMTELTTGLRQTAEAIELRVAKTEYQGDKQRMWSAGLDITGEKITARTGHFEVVNQNGQRTFYVDEQGNLVAEGNGVFRGVLDAMGLNIFGRDGVTKGIILSMDETGMPHLIFNDPHGTPMYDLGYTGLKDLISDAREATLYDLGSYQMCLDWPINIDGVKDKINTTAFTKIDIYKAAYTVDNSGEKIYGKLADIDNMYVKDAKTATDITEEDKHLLSGIYIDKIEISNPKREWSYQIKKDDTYGGTDYRTKWWIYNPINSKLTYIAIDPLREFYSVEAIEEHKIYYFYQGIKKKEGIVYIKRAYVLRLHKEESNPNNEYDYSKWYLTEVSNEINQITDEDGNELNENEHIWSYPFDYSLN